MARYTDGRPEEEFLTRAHQREARSDTGELEEDEIPTVDILVDRSDVGPDDLSPPERDERVPPWWRIRRDPVYHARGLSIAVLVVFALSVVLIGTWALTTGALPEYELMQPSPQALPGAEDVAEPGSGDDF